MNLQDILFGPLTLFLVLFLAFLVRKKIDHPLDRRIFIPALSLKLLGAILLGIIYQFYYGAGDTLNYYSQGQIITEALKEDIFAGIELLLSDGDHRPRSFEYSSKLWWFYNKPEMFIVKLSGLFGYLVFDNYTTVSIIFSLISFSGSWALYISLSKIYPNLKNLHVVSIFFIPSIIFWGSGLMKDTVMIGMLGWLFFAFYHAFILKKKIIFSIIVALICIHVLFTIRIYILLAFLPPAFFWIFLENSRRIRIRWLRYSLRPVFLAVGLFLAYYVAINVTEGSNKYDIQNLAERTKINAEYLYYISQQQQGSAYYLGSLDGTFQSIIKLAPSAVLVTFYRPFIWEVRNPLMLLSSIEAFIFLGMTIYIFIKPGPFLALKKIIREPLILFSLIFSITLAVGVGLNSFNFGTLVRYKIPLLPFLCLSLLLIINLGRPRGNKFIEN